LYTENLTGQSFYRVIGHGLFFQEYFIEMPYCTLDEDGSGVSPTQRLTWNDVIQASGELALL